MSESLMDTNAAIALINGDGNMEQIVGAADEIFVSIIGIGKLYFGAEKSARSQLNLKKVDRFAERFAILTCDIDTARHYGKILRQLRTIGRPIPQNDVWIAAIARQYDLTLLTRDKHFEHVENLALQSW